MGGASRAARRKQLRQQARQQWLPDDAGVDGAAVSASAPPPVDPARDVAEPSAAYVAQPDGAFRALNEGEALLVADTMAKPRRRWYASMRG
jgi:hypothetical protein